MTKIPLKSGKISQKSSFFRGGQSDFFPILGGSSIWSPYLGRSTSLLHFLGGVHLVCSNFRGGHIFAAEGRKIYGPPQLLVFLTSSLNKGNLSLNNKDMNIFIIYMEMSAEKCPRWRKGMKFESKLSTFDPSLVLGYVNGRSKLNDNFMADRLI